MTQILLSSITAQITLTLIFAFENDQNLVFFRCPLRKLQNFS